MPMKNWLSIARSLAVCGLVAMAVLPSVAFAQPNEANQSTAPLAGKREQIKRKLMAFRAFRLTEELGLDEATATRVFPLLGKYDQRVEQLTLERRTLNKQLRQRTREPNTTNEIIDRILANRRATLELDEQRISELRKVLTPDQTARLLVILPEIERQIKNQIRRSSPPSRDEFAPRGQRNKRRRAGQPQAEMDDLE